MSDIAVGVYLPTLVTRSQSPYHTPAAVLNIAVANRQTATADATQYTRWYDHKVTRRRSTLEFRSGNAPVSPFCASCFHPNHRYIGWESVRIRSQ